MFDSKEKEYSFTVDAKCTVSGVVKASSMKEAISKALSCDDADVYEVDYDLPYGFSDFDDDQKAYELGLQEEKPKEPSKYRCVLPGETND